MTRYVSDWIARATDDLQAIEILLREDGPSNPICFHAQQAAEKYLKGFLASRGIVVRKVHDLGSTLSECVGIDKDFETLRTDAEYLEQYYIEARYPTEIPTFSRTDAEKSAAAARRIRDFVEPRLR